MLNIIGADCVKDDQVQSALKHKSQNITPRLSTTAPVSTDYWPRVQAMISSDIGSRWELLFRFGVVSICGIFFIFATGSALNALWLLGFLAINGSYSVLLTRVSQPVRARTYHILLALLFASVSTYTFWAIFVFSSGTFAGVTCGVGALVALAVFNISRNRRGVYAAIWSALHVFGAGLYFGLSSLIGNALGYIDAIIIAASTIGACGYYCIAHYRIVKLHQDLDRSREEAIQTQKMRAIGQLTAGVAHDFNNLLTVIRGNIELAELGGGDPDRMGVLNEAKAAADRAATLTSQLLSFSRRARLQSVPVELNTFWENFRKLVTRTLPAHIAVHVAADPMLRQLYCDQNQLESALLNLVINARDAMDGTGQVYLRSRPAQKTELAKFLPERDHQRMFGAIEVRDTGPGIPAELLDLVSEPFFTTKAPGKGSGLGLSMVRGFCEQSGGGMRIDSSDKGTTITLLLPVDPG